MAETVDPETPETFCWQSPVMKIYASHDIRSHQWPLCDKLFLSGHKLAFDHAAPAIVSRQPLIEEQILRSFFLRELIYVHGTLSHRPWWRSGVKMWPFDGICRD
ncbi:hypothetical protein CDAR_97241 [Caerostris darwini]|uniref:Uncharacterized protein n=1 Tax=Caerostris darwini TaxID=1538125 RepID=A0AAV4QRA2_9ARAC|nr:hypothetical protein CDAR_97241 [Caerostris darwini]